MLALASGWLVLQVSVRTLAPPSGIRAAERLTYPVSQLRLTYSVSQLRLTYFVSQSGS